MQPLGYSRRCYRFIGLDHGDELDRRNDKCEGIRELAWYPSSYSSTRKFATSEVGPKMRLRLLSAHHTAHLRNCKLYDWADLDRQDCCRSLAAKRKLLENLSRRQATWLVEGRSPLEHLLGLWIRSKAGAISLEKSHNILSSTGYQAWPLHASATCWWHAKFRTLPITQHVGLDKPFNGPQSC